MATFPSTSPNHPRRPRAAARARRRWRASLEWLETRLTPATGSISGVVFNDGNGNGTQDAGEVGIAGRTVFLDLNQDGAPDNGEPTATTASDGSYQFTGLAPGTYLIGQVLPTGWRQTAPVTSAERQVTVTAGTPYTFTFQNLASTSDQTIPTYHENGFTFTTNVQQAGQFTVYGSSDSARYAGKPALSAEWAPSTISLTHDDGTPFALTSMDLSPIWTSIYSVTVSFTGHKADGTTVQQSFPIGSNLGFTHVTFTGFTNLTSVTWNSTGYNDYHQFTNVTVATGSPPAVTGVNFGTAAVSGPPVATNDTYSVNENTALTTINPVTTAVSMTSQPGDYIGQGKTYNFSPANATITASVRSGGVYTNTVLVSVTTTGGEWWNFNFAAPNNARLIPGTYTNVQDWPVLVPNTPGLDVSGDGRGSDTVTGQFTVTQAVYDASGNIVSFAASFVQYSGGSTASLSGNVSYQAPTAPPPGVLSNDFDPQGLPLSATLVAGPSHGALALNADGTFTYTPSTNYYGPDSFAYQAGDGTLTSNVATVSLTVNHVNQPPVATNESFGAAKNQPLAVAAPGVLAGASDPDPNTTLTAKLVAGPAHGQVTLNADGSFTYTPAANFLGPDSFTFKANDGQLDSNVATVSLTVTGPDDPPVAVNHSDVVTPNVALKQAAPGVLANDSDPNGQPITAALVAGPSHGTLALNADGSFTYTPITGYHGPDSFTYKANDGQLDSNVATVSLAVDGAPVAVADSYSTNENQALTVAAPGVLVNDSDPDGDPITPVVTASPLHGALTLNADGSLAYTPANDFFGTDSFTYEVTDGTLTSAPVADTITVAHVNQPPVAQDDAYTLPQYAPLTAVAGQTFLTMTSQPGEYVGGGQSYSYTPADGTFTAYGNGNHVEIAFHTPGYSHWWYLNFAAPNNGPLVPGTYTGATRYPFQASNVPGLDVSGDGRGYNTEVGQFTVTQAVYDASGNVISFAASFEQQAYAGAPALTGQVDFNFTNNHPDGVLYNDTDPDPNTTLTAKLVSGPTHGALALNTDGSFTYTPAPGFFGTDSFTYNANDGQLDSNVATVTLTVQPPPVVDNGDPGYSEQGTAGWWFTNGAPGGYGGSSREVYPGDGSHTATWLVTLPAGTYNVEATWLPLSGLADNAPYRIYEGNTLLRTVFVNQQLPPSGADTAGGVTFQHLAYVTLDGSGPLRVVLGNDADGVVQADAVRFVTAAAPSADLNWAGGGVTAPTSIDNRSSVTVSRTYTITGSGLTAPLTIAYYASASGVFGADDNELLGTETVTDPTQLTAGTHAGVSPPLTFSALGTFTVFAVLDPSDAIDETDETNNVAAAANPVEVSGAEVVDNADAGYTESPVSGIWVTSGIAGGFGGSVREAHLPAPVSSPPTATWSLGVLPAGTYDVQATWLPLLYNAPAGTAYNVYEGDTLLLTSPVDQQLALAGPDTAGGVTFQNLGAVTVDGLGPVWVTVINTGGPDDQGNLQADAVRVVSQSG